MKTLKEKISRRSNGEIIGYFNHENYRTFLNRLKKDFGYTHRKFINTRSLSGALIIKEDGLYLGGGNIKQAGTGYKICDEIITSYEQLTGFIYGFDEKYGTKFTFLSYQKKLIVN